MNYQIKEITQPDIWDKFILCENPWSFFQSFAWGELQRTLGYEVKRWGVFQNSKLIGLAQTVIVRARRGTFLHIRHGPVWTKEFVADSQVWRELLKSLRAYGEKQRAWFIRISPMVDDSETNREFLRQLNFRPSPIHRMDGEICWVLDLTPSENELLSGMRKTTRYLIRQAEKLGVVIEESTDISEFTKLYFSTSKRQNFVPHQGIEEEFRLFNKNQRGRIYLGKYNNQVSAGALILDFGSQTIYHHGASYPSKIPVSYLLQWRAIQAAKKRGKKLYNFWGISSSDNPRHPWWGITLFKQGFGGRETQFLHAHDLPLSPFYGISYIIEMLRKFSRGY